MSNGDPYQMPDYLTTKFKETLDTGDDSHFSYELNDIIHGLSEQNQNTVNRARKIAENDVDHPIFTALSELEAWYIHGEYQNGAIEAKDSLAEATERFQKEGWERSVFICLLQEAKLVLSLSGSDANQELNDCLDYILEQGEITSHPDSVQILDLLNRTPAYQIFDLIVDYEGKVPEEVMRRACELASFGAQRFRARNKYRVERDWLKHHIQLARILNNELDVLSSYIRLLDSFEATVNAESRHNVKASTLHEAIIECQDILTTEEQRQLTGRVQEEERKASEEGEYRTLEQTVPREEVEDRLKLFEDQFKKTSSISSPQAALWNSAYLHEFFPHPNLITDREVGITDLASRRMTDTEYNPISTQPGGIEHVHNKLPGIYKMQLQLNDQILSDCLIEQIDSYQISEDEFVGIVNSIPGLSKSDVALLESAVKCYFDGNYSASYHLSVMRLEGVLKRVLQSRGEVTNALKPDDSIEQRSLSGLLDIVIERDPFLGYYLKYKYSDKQGQNLRNRVAHSQIFYAEMTPSNSILALYDVLRAGIRIKFVFGTES